MPAKINCEDLLQELRDLTEELGRPPKKEDVEEKASYSYSTYCRRLGGVGKACRKAGIEPNQPGYSASDEDVLQELHRLNDEIGRPPTQSDIEEHGKYSCTLYKSRFGSIPDARKAAGLAHSPYRPGRHATDEELLEELRDLTDKLDRLPSVDDIKENGQFSPPVYRDRFGSVPDARSKAGLADGDLQWRAGPETVEKSELLDQLQQVADKVGRSPLSIEIEEHADHAVQTYIKKFGSIGEARTAAGLGQPQRPNHGYSSDELIDQLQDLADELDRPPKKEDINNNDLSLGPYYRVFGSLPDAREVAGFDRHPYSPGKEATDEELLADLQSIAEELGHPPTQTQLDERSEYSVGTYRNRFDGLRKAREKAGLDRAPHSPGADAGRSDLVDELKRIHDEIDRPPTADDIREHSTYSIDPFYNHFDSIRDAREAAGLARHVSLTDIERIGFDVLDRVGVEYERFFQVGKYETDALLPNHDLVIEFDGEYWHAHHRYDSLDEKQELIRDRDRRKDTHLSENGFNVVRIWGPDLRENPDQVAEILGNIVNGEKGHLHGTHISV